MDDSSYFKMFAFGKTFDVDAYLKTTKLVFGEV